MKTTFETRCGISPRIHELSVDCPLYRYTADNTPAGVISSGYIGVGIWFVSGSYDEVIAAWGGIGDGWTGAARHAVYTTPTGRDYIRKGGRRWYLDQALRVAA